jgi:hypothetical protein
VEDREVLVDEFVAFLQTLSLEEAKPYIVAKAIDEFMSTLMCLFPYEETPKEIRDLVVINIAALGRALGVTVKHVNKVNEFFSKEG